MQKPKFGLFLANLFRAFSLALFFPFFSFFIGGFVAHFIVFLLHGIVAGLLFRKVLIFNIQRVVCKQRNWQWIFPLNVTFFCESEYPKRGIVGTDLSFLTLLLTDLLTSTES